jgi:hypothetical protein
MPMTNGTKNSGIRRVIVDAGVEKKTGRRRRRVDQADG